MSHERARGRRAATGDGRRARRRPAELAAPDRRPRRRAAPRSAADARVERLKDKLLGPALPNEALAHERLGQPDRAGRVLLRRAVVDGVRHRGDPADAARRRASACSPSATSCRSPSPWSCVLAILMFSYRQTIKAYPSAGGAYIVTKDNLGLLPGPGRRRRAAHRLHPHRGRVGVGRHRRALLGRPRHVPLAGADRARLHRPHRRGQPARRQGVGPHLRRPDLLLRRRRCSSIIVVGLVQGGDRRDLHHVPPTDPAAPRARPARSASSCCSTPSPPAAPP